MIDRRGPSTWITLSIAALVISACGRVDEDSDAAPRCGMPVSNPDELVPEVDRPRPELGLMHTDPALGGCLARVSDHAISSAAQAAPNRQAFATDGAHVLLGTGVVLDTSRYAPVATLPNAPGVWAQDLADRIYFVAKNQLERFDLKSGTSEVVASFSEYSELDANAGLRDPSLDGRFIALIGERAADGVYEVFVWDFSKHEKSPALAGPVDVVMRATAPRFARVSPSGKWVVVGWPDAGDGVAQGVEVYDAKMRFHAHASESALAADLALDENGEEWLVDLRPGESGLELVKTSLANARETPLLALDWFENVRISCAADHADACAISTQGDISGKWHAFQDELFAVGLGSRLDAPVVERLVHHESAPEFVAAQAETSCPLSPEAVLPNPVSSRDGKSVLFTSNWNANCFGELYRAVR